MRDRKVIPFKKFVELRISYCTSKCFSFQILTTWCNKRLIKVGDLIPKVLHWYYQRFIDREIFAKLRQRVNPDLLPPRDPSPLRQPKAHGAAPSGVQISPEREFAFHVSVAVLV